MLMVMPNKPGTNFLREPPLPYPTLPSPSPQVNSSQFMKSWAPANYLLGFLLSMMTMALYEREKIVE